jgi:hypothetical protein
MFRRRRPLMRAAVVGGSAFAVGRHVANNNAHEAAQDEQIDQMQNAQAPAAPPPPAPVAPAAPAPATEEDRLASLSRLGDLLQSGVLTQAEFDAEKAKVLGGG